MREPKRKPWLVVALMVFACALPCAAQGLVHLPFDGSWSPRSKGPWEMRVDHRDLLAMRHRWTPSETGDFASYSYEAIIPEGWQPPIYLSFYCSDDYDASVSDVPDPLTAEGFVGHRKKEVWVNDSPVWTADVSDPVVKGRSRYERVPIKAAPGDAVKVTLLVFDTVASARPMPADFFKGNDDPNERVNFQTHVYWGDVYLVEGHGNTPKGNRPSQAKVLAIHNQRWPLPPFGRPWEGPIDLAVSSPGGIPNAGFPLRMGIPTHAGKVTSESDVRIAAAKSSKVPVQTHATSWWPDESIRWLSTDMIVKPGIESVRVEPGTKADGVGRGPKIEDLDGPISVTWGGFSLKSGLHDLLYAVTSGKNTLVDALKIRLTTPEGDTSAIPGLATVIEQGPARTTLMVDGRFETADTALASFRLYLSVFGDLPYIKGWFRLYNDTERDLSVSGLALSLRLAAPEEVCAVPGASLQVDGRLTQDSAESRVARIGDETITLAPYAPAYAQSGGVTLVVRQFRELFPKAFHFRGDTLDCDLIAGGATPTTFTPGEAKTHEFWIGLGAMDAVALAAAVEHPPILQNAAYYTASGALGPAAPHEGIDVLHTHMTTAFGEKSWNDFGQRFGVRDFPDAPYFGGLPNWSNNYYERMLNLWSEWYIGGDRAWYDLATDVSRHLMDVAIVRSAVPGRDWLGAMHGPGVNHVAGPWNPTLRIEGLLQHAQITGDPEVEEAALSVADYCVRTGAGIDGGSVRQQAGPFDAICTAFAETGEVVYLDDGQKRVDSVYRSLDVRRGVWPDIHGSQVYRGNVPWMDAQMARPLYWWYRLTGDVKAAQAVVALADSIIAENTDWHAPGAVYGYSHNPRFAMTAAYDLLIVPVIFAAYELTDDPFYLEAAKAQWERWKSSGQFDSPLNCYWNVPWLVDYLKRYGVEGKSTPPQPAEDGSSSP